MSKKKDDIVGLLPFNTQQLQELLVIYQDNYEELLKAYNQTISFLVLFTLRSDGIIEVPLDVVDAMNEKQKYHIEARRDEERGVFVVTAREQPDEQESEVPVGLVSTDESDERSGSDTG